MNSNTITLKPSNTTLTSRLQRIVRNLLDGTRLRSLEDPQERTWIAQDPIADWSQENPLRLGQIS